MAMGPGKYDAICTEARLKTQATGVALVVIQGEHGSGFSVQAPDTMTRLLPVLLRRMADEIERSFQQDDERPSLTAIKKDRP